MRVGSPPRHCSGRVPYPLKTPRTWSREGPVPHTGGSRNATSVEETPKSSIHKSSCAGPSGDWDEALLSPFKGRGEAKERRVEKKHEHRAQPNFSFKTFFFRPNAPRRRRSPEEGKRSPGWAPAMARAADAAEDAAAAAAEAETEAEAAVNPAEAKAEADAAAARQNNRK